MKNGNKVMKITKGVIRTEERIQDIPAYVTKCSSSLMHFLEEGSTVTIKAMGNRAIANTMKTIARAGKLLETENKILEISTPVFILEKIADTDSELAVFNINVSVR